MQAKHLRLATARMAIMRSARLKRAFRWTYVPFAEPTERSFDDVFFGEWLEDPIAFGAFEGDKLIGYVEGSMEGWNNRFRLSNICVLDFSERSRGVGTALMKPIERAAEDAGARMLILETQSCNGKRHRVL